MDGRPHLFHNLSLSLQFLHRYQLILVGDRGTRVSRSCLKLLCQQCSAGVKPVVSVLITSLDALPAFHISSSNVVCLDVCVCVWMLNRVSVRHRRKNIDLLSKSNPLYYRRKKLRRIDVKTASSSWKKKYK